MIDSAPVVVYCLFVLSGHQSEEDVSDEMIRRRQEYGEYFRQGHGKENNRQWHDQTLFLKSWERGKEL